MSAVFTVCGNYVTPEIPREQWYNWRYAVDAIDEVGAPAMAGIQVLAEISSSTQVDGKTTHLSPRAAAYAAVHPDDVPWEADLCLAYLDMAEEQAAREEAEFQGSKLPEFTVCGTLEDYNCGSHVWQGYGPWSAYWAVYDDFRKKGHKFYLAAVHPGVIPTYDTLVFADATSKSAAMMEMTARDIWGVKP